MLGSRGVGAPVLHRLRALLGRGVGAGGRGETEFAVDRALHSDIGCLVRVSVRSGASLYLPGH